MNSTTSSRPRGLQALLLTLLLAVMATSAAPGVANAWWRKDWPYRRQITLDTTAKGVPIDQPIGRAPLLIRLHSGNFRFDDAAQDGSDLRFLASDDKTPLAYHIESFDPLLGVATIWVDVRDFPVSATQSIWMYYGNKKASAAVDTAGTFDPDYTAVYHFDAPQGAPPKDKTAYGDNAQTAPAAVEDGSVIGRGARFDGAGPMIIPASPSLAVAAGGAFTFSAWVRPDQLQSAALYARRAATGALVIGIDQGQPFVQLAGQTIKGSAALTQGQWSHIAVTADGRTITLYVNGHPAGAAAAALPALDGPIALGGDLPGGSLAGFKGGLDEARFSKIARPPALLLMDAASQGAESRLVAFNADEKQSGLGFGYFGVIFKNITPDAWVVISILMVMAVLSWIVMWIKGDYVGAVGRGDRAFAERFRAQARTDLLALDVSKAGAAAPNSALYRIYQIGVQELHARGDLQGRPLTEETIASIRASLDAQQVEENQKLDRYMVLLTIAISGGPFIGLLGTVLGVMITFAAIAAAGDVNVNAIAPGIAAALLATVAGLFVAIPALFGYNYLASRNADLSAKMQVFADQFITRLAEVQRNASISAAAMRAPAE